jgi:N-acetylneuraminate lyase
MFTAMFLATDQRLHGLVAATHTPFHADGSLNLAIVEQQAALMVKWEVGAVFIGGTTGESSSLTLDERRALAQRWSEVVRGTALRLVVHVGANGLADARVLAAQAEQLGALAISAVAPCYFKPRDLDTLIASMSHVAAAAPGTPFYYYDIPSMTGLSHSMPDFLERAPAHIPTLAGLKFTNPDLMSYQYVLRAGGGSWDVPFGVDEHMLGALAMGARGAVGSGFNFAAPIYQRLLRAFAMGDLGMAREEQFRGVQLIKLFGRHGYMGAAKATMQMLGVDVGPARLPNTSLDAAQATELRAELEALGFFDWVR